jgi:hypothetical protein
MLMLGMLRFMLECTQLTRERTRTSLISSVSLSMPFSIGLHALNNMRADVVVLLYDDHDRVVKILHSLDHTVWEGKVKAILESEMYDTLTVNELFLKLKSIYLDRGVTARLESPTDSHSLALISGKGPKSNASTSSELYSLSSLMTLLDEGSMCLERTS